MVWLPVVIVFDYLDAQNDRGVLTNERECGVFILTTLLVVALVDAVHHWTRFVRDEFCVKHPCIGYH